MNKLLKTMAIAMTMAIAAPAASFAASVDMLLYFKPGGSTDKHIQQMKPLMEAQGIEVNVQYIKSCAEAIKYTEESNNDVLFYMLTGDYNPGATEGRCVLPTTMKMKAVAIPYVGPLNVCVGPAGKGTTLADLQAGKSVTIGLGAGGKSKAYWEKSMAAIGATGVEFKQYRGGGKKNKAATAGDVDLYTSVNQGINRVKGNSGCILSTVRNDLKGTPFVGDVIGDANYPEFTDGQIIFANNPNSEAAKVYRNILTTTSYIQSQKDNLLSVPALSETEALMEVYGK